MGYSPLASRSAEVWSDDFDDGNYDGWTICENPDLFIADSNWSAADYCLEIVQEDWGIISYPSSVAYGTWSFDFKANESQVTSGAQAEIVFISSNLDGNEPEDWYGYWVHFAFVSAEEDYEFALSLRKGDWSGDTTTVCWNSTSVPVAGWHHIDVTRNTTGSFSVFHNGSLSMQGEDTEYDSSELFALQFEQGQMIDNIVIDDEITVTPPTTTPTTPPTSPTTTPPPFDWLPIGIGVSAVVIVLVLVIILKRR
jgi:hypothetical protein